MKNIKIKGYGYAKAEKYVTNRDLSKIVDTSDEWIIERTGIKTRYISENENTSELAYRAAKDAIENASINKNEIDLIIVATTTPDNFTPSTACLLQEKLGLNGQHIMAFDLNAACSGFLYAMHTACALLNQYKCALVVGAEVLSKIINWKDRNTCVLFGDGAGALIIERQETLNTIEFYANAIGDAKGILKAEGISMEQSKTFGYLKMDGKEVFRFAVKAMEEAMLKVLEQANVNINEIDLIIPHQANIRIIKYVAKHMKLDENRFFINLDQFGNTSSASVAIALAQAKELGKIHEGMKVLLVGFGAGFTYAASYIEL